MKRKVLGTLLTVSLLTTVRCVAQHQPFRITFSPLLWQGKTPTTTPLSNQQAIETSRATTLIRYFTDSTKLDFKCIYNGCQNRATVMSLYLQRKGIRHYKIWNFNPFKLALYNKQDALDVPDPLKLKSTSINWDFHVAVALLTKNTVTGRPDTLVLDPAFVQRPIRVKEWLSLQNSPNSYYTFLDPLWYNYVTLTPGTLYSCNGNPTPTSLNLPTCFPQILTGDFYPYDIDKEVLAAQEMATNDHISKAAKDLITRFPVGDPRRVGIVELITNFNRFQSVLQGQEPLDAQHPFYVYLNPYRQSYSQSLAYWQQELKRLR